MAHQIAFNGLLPVHTVEVRLTTDGACQPNPGSGGWCAILRTPHRVEILRGGETDTTNNRMEMMAVIEGLNALPDPTTVEVRSDSQYVVKGMTLWLRNWQRKGFLNVKNVDLWRRLIQAAAPHRIQWTWIKGHAGDPDNEAADYWATLSIPKVEVAPVH